jgi:hypothetical protein
MGESRILIGLVSYCKNIWNVSLYYQSLRLQKSYRSSVSTKQELTFALSPNYESQKNKTADGYIM